MNEELTEKFVTWLDPLLRQLGWSDAQLASRAGLSHTVIGRARKGILPKYKACLAIADALGKSPEEVLRAAGILLTEPSEWEEAKYLFSKMNDSNRAEMLEYMRFKMTTQKENEGAETENE